MRNEEFQLQTNEDNREVNVFQIRKEDDNIV